MNRYALLIIAASLFVGCLKTRAELEAEESGAHQQRQTVVQQRTQGRESREQRETKEARPTASQPSSYRFEEYDEQFRTLSGRVDSLEGANAQMSASKQGDKDASARDKQAFDQKFLAYEEALKKMEAQITALNDEIARLKAPPPEPAPTVGAGGKMKSVYEQGEEQFATKKWKESIVSYQKYRDQNPKGKAYADATYKMGVAFQELGMKDEARSFYEEVATKFPNSKDAKKASTRMKTLK